MIRKRLQPTVSEDQLQSFLEEILAIKKMLKTPAHLMPDHQGITSADKAKAVKRLFEIRKVLEYSLKVNDFPDDHLH